MHLQDRKGLMVKRWHEEEFFFKALRMDGKRIWFTEDIELFSKTIRLQHLLEWWAIKPVSKQIIQNKTKKNNTTVFLLILTKILSLTKHKWGSWTQFSTRLCPCHTCISEFQQEFPTINIWSPWYVIKFLIPHHRPGDMWSAWPTFRKNPVKV